MKLLTRFEARLQVVPRWSIVQTIQKQSVAEHSFRVALIAPRLLELLGGKTDLATVALLTKAALLHDQFEAFTGDIPSPAKTPLGVVKGQAERHFGPYASEQISLGTLEEKALKGADLIEAIYFLYEDERLGNMSLQWIVDDLSNRLLELIGEGLGQRILDNIFKKLDEPQDPLDFRSARATAGSKDSDIPC